MKDLLKGTLLLIVFLLAANVSMAQPTDPPTPEQPVPIGAIEILMAAGGAFGLKKILDSKKKSK